jgi:hypothetical protein
MSVKSIEHQLKVINELIEEQTVFLRRLYVKEEQLKRDLVREKQKNG